MKQPGLSRAVVVCCASGVLVLACCSSPEAEKPASTARTVAHSSVTTRPGVAGGLVEDTYVAEAEVSAIDMTMRRVTLRGHEGKQFTYEVSPQIMDISRLQIGDKVKATFSRRVNIEVRSDNAAPSEAYEKTWGASRAGEMPGRLSASESKKVARVVEIDPAGRTARLEFTDGTVRVPVRSDVDLSQYKVGDNVIIRVTTNLSVLSK